MWFRRLLITLIFAGVVLRFANLGQRHYWYDEALGSYRAAGAHLLIDDLDDFRASSFSPTEVRVLFQEPSPGPPDQVIGLGNGDRFLRFARQYEPLYTTLAHHWMVRFGSEPAVMRALPALAGVLLLGAVYLLGRSLAWPLTTTLLAMAFTAVSPLLVAYAREARPYSLLTLWIVLSTAVFLHAANRGGLAWWLLYTLLLIAGLYTQVTFLGVIMAHGLFLLYRAWQDRRARPRPSTAAVAMFGSSAGLALLAFSPWILFWVPRHPVQASSDSYLAQPLPVSEMLLMWIKEFSWPLVDAQPLPALPEALLYLVAGGILVGALLLVTRRFRAQDTLILSLLFACTFLPLLTWDLLRGGQRSMQPRFILPALLAALLALAFLLGWRVASSPRWPAWQAAATGLLLLAFAASLYTALAPAGRGKGDDELQTRVVRALNSVDQALVLIGDIDEVNDLGDLMGLSHNVGDQIRFQFVSAPTPPTSAGRAVFLYQLPSDQVAAYTRGACSLRETVPGKLWQVESPGCLVTR